MIAVVLADAEELRHYHGAAMLPSQLVPNVWSLSENFMSKSGNTDRFLGPARETAGEQRHGAKWISGPKNSGGFC
jgi:hypothetical protein